MPLNSRIGRCERVCISQVTVGDLLGDKLLLRASLLQERSPEGRNFRGADNPKYLIMSLFAVWRLCEFLNVPHS